MERWKQAGGQAGRRVSEPERKEGREIGEGLVSSRSQSEGSMVLCRVNLTLATQ